ncbi:MULTISPECIES: AAA family ATPase [unclassified Nocardia]|uniref:NACHT and WD repeat domain-containing protein n=1 Tax=unclassified Nocardia TaxID=2637762 RepID=UPI001CE441A1|nr:MULTISPECIES: AAA family ATPase [unclassified Nocardia]
MPSWAGGIDPSQIHTRGEFITALRQLIERIGQREAARRARVPEGTVLGWCRSTLPEADSHRFEPLLRVCGVNETEFPEWWAALYRARRTQPDPGESPYPGLAPYDASRAVDFCGRGELTAELRATVRACLDGAEARPVIVIGESGVGKSSLLLAGLEPGFGQVAVLAPGTKPLMALGNAIDEVEIGPDTEFVLIVDQCEELWTLEPIVGDDDALRARWEQERDEFLAELAAWANRPHTAVVIGLRADYFGRAAADPFLQRALHSDRLITVTPMNRRQLLEVITKPASERGITVEEALVDRLLEELKVTEGGSDGGALPQLSEALKRTWDIPTRTEPKLTWADYRSTGGIGKVVELSAEKVYGALDEHEQLIARRVVTRCVVVTEESAARRRVARTELAWADAEPAVVDSVIAHFTADRLLTSAGSGVQLTHEALLTAWPRLAEWIGTDRATLLRHRRLGNEAEVWAENGRRERDLLSSGRTDEFQEWADTQDRYKELTVREREFLDACVAHWARVRDRDRKRVAELARTVEERDRTVVELDQTVHRLDRTVHDLETSRHTLRRRAMALIVVAVLAVAAALGAGAVSYALVLSRHELQRTTDEALSRQGVAELGLLRSRDPGLAQQLALIGYRFAPTVTVEARSALLDSTGILTPVRTATVPGPIGTALNRDSTLLAVVNSDGAARLIDRRKARNGPVGELKVGDDRLYAAAFAPDRPVLAIGGGKTLTLWDVSVPEKPSRMPTELQTGGAKIGHLAWSPDGRELAAATATGIQRWRIDGASADQEPSLDIGAPMNAVAYSPDGALLAGGGEGQELHIWQRASAAPIGRLTMTNVVLDLQFDPTSTRLVVGSQALNAVLVDIADPAHPAQRSLLGAFGSFVNSVGFSPDGATIAAGSSDNSTQLFRTAAATAVVPGGPPTIAVRTLPGTALVTSVAMAADAVISTSTDGIVHEWPTATDPGTDDLGGRIFTVPASVDGRTALVGLVAPNGSPHNVIDRFELPRTGPPRPIEPPLTIDPGLRLSGVAAISDDGRTAAAGTTTGDIYLWDIGVPTDPRRSGERLHISPKSIAEAVFTPDARYLFAASASDGAGNVISVIDRGDPNRPRVVDTLRTTTLPLLLTVSADGTLLAAATATDVTVWDISRGPGSIRIADRFTGFGSTVTSVRFGPGHLLAAGSDDRTVRIWNLTAAGEFGKSAHLTGPTGSIESLTFNRDGTRLAAGIGDTEVWIWDTSDPAHPATYATLTAYGGRVNDVAYGPDGAQLIAGGLAGVLRTWATDPEAVVAALCANPASVITKDEWAQQFPGVAYRNPC